MRLDVVKWAEAAFDIAAGCGPIPNARTIPIGATEIPGAFSCESHPTLGWTPVRVNRGRPGSQPNLPRCLKDAELELHVWLPSKARNACCPRNVRKSQLPNTSRAG